MEAGCRSILPKRHGIWAEYIAGLELGERYGSLNKVQQELPVADPLKGSTGVSLPIVRTIEFNSVINLGYLVSRLNPG